MSLNSGGHLTHGAKPSQSGKWFNAVHYEVDKETGLIDYENVEKLALEHKPKIIIAGGSAYSRIIDFKKFRVICDKIKAFLLVDMAHFSGLVAGGEYPNPIDYADVVTSTTHKVLRGPRGGIGAGSSWPARSARGLGAPRLSLSTRARFPTVFHCQHPLFS